jgi:3'-5' exoribonuclease
MDTPQLEVGSMVSDVFLVADVHLGTDKRGQKYYSLVVNCKGGRQVDAKIWSDNIASPLERGQAIEVMARVEEFRGQTQLNIQSYSLIPAQNFDPSPYVMTTDIDTDEAYDKLFNWANAEYSNPYLKKLMAELYANAGFAKQFKTSPAASKHHHNYRGGLIEHTLDVWNIADKLCQYYGGKINRELLLAGAALHDIGKIKCYNLVSGVSETTETGKLIDHVFIGASMISNLWDRVFEDQRSEGNTTELDREKALLLHMTLSHHGKREWGATVLPRTPEAILLHYCDQMSATMWTCFNAIDQIPEGEQWTDWLRVMDEGREMFAASNITNDT